MTARLAAALTSGLLAAGFSLPAHAIDITVESARIDTFRDLAVGQLVDGLIWQGGLVMTSQSPEFGGLSGITFTGPDGQLTTVSDVGNFISGQLIYDDAGRPLELVGVTVEPIRNSKGAVLPRAFAQDAEAIETIERDGSPAAVRVGFENLTRVADFELTNYRPDGAATEVAIPEWLEDMRTNESLESVCIAPPASPVAGSTLLIAEAGYTPENHLAATLLGVKDRGSLSLIKADGVNPTACAFLPDGDLLVLERGTGFLSFVMQVRRVPADQVQPGTIMDGEVILRGSGGDIDNMEGIATHRGPGGDVRISIISDDNFNEWERTLLLQFSLPE